VDWINRHEAHAHRSFFLPIAKGPLAHAGALMGLNQRSSPPTRTSRITTGSISSTKVNPRWGCLFHGCTNRLSRGGAPRLRPLPARVAAHWTVTYRSRKPGRCNRDFGEGRRIPTSSFAQAPPIKLLPICAGVALPDPAGDLSRPSQDLESEICNGEAGCRSNRCAGRRHARGP